MIEAIIILALIGLIAFQEYYNRKERSKLVNAILAKSINDFKDMELADKTQVKVTAPKSPDIFPLEGLTDEDWYESQIKGKRVR